VAKRGNIATRVHGTRKNKDLPRLVRGILFSAVIREARLLDPASQRMLPARGIHRIGLFAVVLQDSHDAAMMV
jgi:hypothetical protein